MASIIKIVSPSFPLFPTETNGFAPGYEER